MIPTEVQPEPIIDERNENSFRTESEISLLDVVAIVLEHRRFVARFVLIATALAVIVSFLLPVRYEGKVLLLPPAQNSSVGSALLGQLGNMGALGSLATLASGGILKNPADMYISLLTSRTVEDSLIQRFGLMKEYHKKRMSDTRKVLERRTSAITGTKDGLIRLTFEDGDPKRAAELANGYVEEFRKLSETLAITEAARRRLFYQQQLQQAKSNLTVAEDAMTKTQRSTGVLEIESQARTLIESAAVLRAQVVAKQVEIESMRSFATDNNPNIILAKQELAGLQSQLERVAGSQQDLGSDINLSKGRVTEAGMEYIRVFRELKYQEAVYELLAKEFEIAKLDEAQEGSIIQVVDSAVTPDKKSFPPRTLITIGTTVFAFFLAIFCLVVRQRLTVASALPENRQRVRDIKDLWNTKPRTP
ncbi:MAG TPA: Wzz/FepE/Etk N-terminal domain-containing protein [Candidatus Aquilonibacter sp.]|nr:Wzz/FepE/Etk N-terminal domain-containing protein [Candidatus Aquilonibacter sp.]